MSGSHFSRRRFVTALAGAVVPLLVPRPGRGAMTRLSMSSDHPTPRPGVDASQVLTADQLHDQAAAPIFDLIREIPQVADGIRCHCGCATLPGYRSLLSCYEAPGMAQHCEICQGQATLAHKLHRQGWSLDGIRAAIDAAYADQDPTGSC